ncbi:MAG: zinc-ribbon domain-containing protein [Candidatus Jordarchaeum sp.]|uniref:zinc-ribbon domain-containing protein n=1 Tax=Candidatus Jordarchaeum sp. TaxID=2823881 RepID=UPI00404A5CC3
MGKFRTTVQPAQLKKYVILESPKTRFPPGKYLCPECGNRLPARYIFCPFCGTKIRY